MAQPQNTQIEDGARLISWTLTTADPTGDPLPFVQYSDRCAQVFGDFGGGSITLQGSMDKINWATLSDSQGNPLTFNAPKLEQILEITRYMRPVLSGSTGGNATVALLVRKQQPTRS